MTGDAPARGGVLVDRWWQLGAGIGATAGAYGLGTALTVLPIQRMIDASGYRAAFIVWGVVQAVVVLVAAQFLTAPSASWTPPGRAQAGGRTRVPQSAVSRTPGEML